MPSNEPLTARVIAQHRERYAVLVGGAERFARLKPGAYRDADARTYPTVGDFVTLFDNPFGDAQVLATHPRRSVFYRLLPGSRFGEQAVAANFDAVLLLTSLNRDFNPQRLARYAAQAWQSGAAPVVVLTKRDLLPDCAAQIEAARAAVPGADVFAISAQTGEGLPALSERLAGGQTAVLLGSSGVGKSSLLNALAGQEFMFTAAIREDDARGRHTTTHRQLVTLPGGLSIIDTPGMRALGLWDAEEGLSQAFEDIEALAAGCRFRDCKHQAEPGCAVKRAIDEGALDAKRLVNYQKLAREARTRRKPKA
ncbi:MAG: ribosome small subunit-dependent GTPase A [Oscillospiraceae bacterium]|jgi:ribosome biogenesis GTPase|nr:ribosome small subunit-dependent GTPase A [Oscillospiraceae bacterium]